LLYRLTQALSELDITIRIAKISTYGERVVDVFYLQDAAGRKIEDPDELERIRSRLLEVLANAPSPAKSRAAATAHREPVSPTPSHTQPKAPSPADTPAE
jgi:[protein-PII] uridylyltransferase